MSDNYKYTFNGIECEIITSDNNDEFKIGCNKYDTIFFDNKYHDKVFFRGNYYKKIYIGNELIWPSYEYIYKWLIDHDSETLIVTGKTEMLNSDWDPYMFNKINVLNNITNVSDDAFNGSFRLRLENELEDSIVSIGDSSFANCKRMKCISLPSSLTHIGNSAFKLCYSLRTILFPENLSYIGNNAFEYCELLKYVSIPDSVAYINDSVFSNCTSLETVKLPDNIIHLGNYVFEYCSNLKDINLPLNITEIPRGFFSHSGLQKFIIPDYISRINDNVFEYSSLQQIDLNNNITYIGNWVFMGNCDINSDIIIPDSVEYLGDGSFRNIKPTTPINVHIGTNVTTLDGESVFGYNNFSKFTVSDKNEHFVAKDGVLYSKNMEELIQYPGGKQDLIFYMPDSVNFLYLHSFSGSDNLGIIFMKNIPEHATIDGNYYEYFPEGNSVTGLSKYTNYDSFERPGLIWWDESDYDNSMKNSVSHKKCIFFYPYSNDKNMYTNNDDVACLSYCRLDDIYSEVTIENNTLVSVSLNYDINSDSYDSKYNIYKSDFSTYLIDGVESIGKSIFEEYDSYYISLNSYNMLVGCKNLIIDVKRIEDRAFYVNSSSNGEYGAATGNILILSDNVEYVGNYAFYRCQIGFEYIVFGNNIKEIGYYAFSDVCLKHVVIPDSVLTVGVGAFSASHYGIMTYLQIGSGLTTISDCCFQGSLTADYLYIPFNIEEIGEHSFASAQHSSTQINKIIYLSNISHIKPYAFTEIYSNGPLSILYIGKNIKQIDEYAFSYWQYGIENIYYNGSEEDWNDIIIGEENDVLYNTQITFDVNSWKITDNILYIDGKNLINTLWYSDDDYNEEFNNIFYKEFNKIVINEGVEKIVDNSFHYKLCNATTISIPSTLCSLSEYEFNGILFNGFYLENINVSIDNMNYTSSDGILFSKDFTTLIRYPINKKGSSYTIPKFVTKVYKYAFYNCKNLHEIYLHDKIEAPYNIYFENTNITFVQYSEENTTIINSYTFNCCSNLKSISGINNISYIDEYAFEGCTKLDLPELPERLNSIGNYAFSGCTNLFIKSFPASLMTIGSYAFNQCSSLDTIKITENIISLGQGAFMKCDNLVSVDMSKSPSTIIQDSLFENCARLKYVRLPNNLTCIKSSAFRGCKKLYNIDLPDSINTIEDHAFSGSGLTNIKLPRYINNIDSYVFADCDNLECVDMRELLTTRVWYGIFSGCNNLKYVYLSDNINIIEDYAFSECYSLTNIELPKYIRYLGNYSFMCCTNLTSITIPDYVTTIREQTFYGCSSLTSITIPDYVTTIGYKAFYNCNSLTDVYYTGSEENWNNIQISSDNNCLKNANIHYNYISE